MLFSTITPDSIKRPQRSASGGPRGRRGISLAELMVVIAIVAMSMAIVVPSMQNAEKTGADTRRVLSDALMARSLARTSWETTWLRTDLQNSRWRVERADGTWVEGPMADSSGWRHLEDGLSFVAVSGYGSDFEFLPNGRSNLSCAVKIVGAASRWTVKLDQLSGSLHANPGAMQ